MSDNSVARLVEAHKCDAAVVENQGDGLVVVTPYDTTTGTLWEGIALITSDDEARASGYPLYRREEPQ